ncbi:nuclease [Methanobrevibacter sp. DSM 116169]|uniref:nuclease n=1 Tax=Methanobrevibacter sp. DSM 116169 TaxID=3242727 RepID=UPI0038FC277D
MFEEDKDNKIYNLIISSGKDENNEYNQFLEKIYSKTDFLWKESVSSSYLTASDEFFNKVDLVIILSGIYKENSEKIDELVKASLKHTKPILLVRPYGEEEVPENLEEVATGIVGWNANCIIGDIKNIVNS